MALPAKLLNKGITDMVRISDARCVAKSWPDFFTAIRECSGADA